MTDHEISRKLTMYWEEKYMEDMTALGVRRPDILTRVTEYVPNIVDFTQKILDEGFAYESGGSVYFDTRKFDGDAHHHYAKLEPKSAFNVQLIEEGEGSISLAGGEKRDPADFALWKASKPGEPEWDSPWSKVRFCCYF